MKQNFNDCLNRLLKDEGGYTNDPRDPGGATNFGITLTDYRKYIDSKGTAESVKHMSVNDAKRIYKSKYWDALDCDNLPNGIDYTCFDYGVNSGLGRPRKALQRFKSLEGTKLIDAINNERMAFLQALHTFPTFGKGWTRRVDGVRAYSKKLATGSNVPATGSAGGVIVAGGAAAAAAPTHMIPYIVGGVVVVAIVVFVVMTYLKWRKNG